MTAERRGGCEAVHHVSRALADPPHVTSLRYYTQPPHRRRIRPCCHPAPAGYYQKNAASQMRMNEATDCRHIGQPRGCGRAALQAEHRHLCPHGTHAYAFGASAQTTQAVLSAAAAVACAKAAVACAAAAVACAAVDRNCAEVARSCAISASMATILAASAAASTRKGGPLTSGTERPNVAAGVDAGPRGSR